MKANIYALTYNASGSSNVGAILSTYAKTSGMQDDAWKSRLIKAIEESGRSKRNLSLAINRSHAYVREFVELGKEPSVPAFLDLCRELDVSAAHILLGIDITAEEEAILRGFGLLTRDQKAAYRQLLQSMQASLSEP
jgi:hypothetical protein